MGGLIIIIIIIRHELGLDRPVSASSNSLFKGLPSRLRPLFYNSALFLESCCSFLLHVVDSLICIFLVSRQLILLSALPKFLHSFCGQKGCIRLSFWKFYLNWCQSFLFFFLRVQISLPYKRMERASALHTVILENF